MDADELDDRDIILSVVHGLEPVDAPSRERKVALARLLIVLLVAIVAIPMLVNAVALLPEILVRIPSVNDDMLHWLFIRNAAEAIAAGANPLDHWVPQIELGVPQFLFYQHLAPLTVVGLERLTIGAISLFDWFNLVRWTLMVAFPLTVFWSMRRMGFSPIAAAISASVASLLSADGLYGFEFDSYVWRGWGLFTQLFAMHLSFVVLALAYRAVRTGRGLALAALAFGALVLSHLIYAYMLGITLVAILLLGMRRATAGERLVREGEGPRTGPWGPPRRPWPGVVAAAPAPVAGSRPGSESPFADGSCAGGRSSPRSRSSPSWLWPRPAADPR